MKENIRFPFAKPIMIALSLLPFASLEAEGSAVWEVDFKSGKFPATVTVDPLSGTAPVSSCYNRVDLTQAWSVGNVEGRYSAISPSHNRTSQPVSNIFRSVAVPIEKGTIIRWEGRTMLPGFPEAYRLLLRTSQDAPWQTVWETEGEEDVWTAHCVSLDAFAGETVEIAFECCSTNKFLLALSNIWAGVPEDTTFACSVFNRGFIANGESVVVEASLVNLGLEQDDIEIILTTDNGSEKIARGWDNASGRHQNLEWEFFPKADSKTTYTLTAAIGGKEEKLATGEVWSSNFRRNLFVDEGTGMWCNNCPDGIRQLAELERTFGDQLLAVSTHANDIFEQPAYWPGLGFYAVPYFKLNRLSYTASSTPSKFTTLYSEPVMAEIELLSAVGEKLNGPVTLSGTVRVADNFAAGELGIAYVMTRTFSFDEFDPEFYQANNATLPSKAQYYFLPTKMPSDITIFRDLNIDGNYGFDAADGVLEEELSAGNDYDFNLRVPVPDLTGDWEDIEITAMVLNRETGEILNSARIGAGEVLSSVSAVSNAEPSYFFVKEGNEVTLCGGEVPAGTIVSVYGADGSLIDQVVLADNARRFALPEVKGLKILSTVCNGETITKKLM